MRRCARARERSGLRWRVSVCTLARVGVHVILRERMLAFELVDACGSVCAPSVCAKLRARERVRFSVRACVRRAQSLFDMAMNNAEKRKVQLAEAAVAAEAEAVAAEAKAKEEEEAMEEEENDKDDDDDDDDDDEPVAKPETELRKAAKVRARCGRRL
eukprot:1982239-Pleurochrysis_carterae.AAC.1